MASNLPVAQVLAKLEAKVAHHRERKAFHAEQKLLHEERQAHHEAVLQTAIARLESFRAAAEAAGELLDEDRSDSPPSAQPELDGSELTRKRALSRMVAQVVEGMAPDETFGARAVTREVQKRWGEKLRRKPDPRSVASTLRRWALAGRIRQVREGRAYYESLYTRVPQTPGG